MRYLITGGAGYFGRAFAKHLLGAPRTERVAVFSRGEYAQERMRSMLPDPDQKMRYLIGDVRDADRLHWAMRDIDVVVHAAALKRIEVGHYNPEEMVATNIVGTKNVIQAARDNCVDKVVLLSSDKACNPRSAYGISKAMAECLMLAANHNSGELAPAFIVCRYGNVAGSTGSVIPTWRRLIRNGADSVPVTDPDCTRFWMSRQQAVRFVADAIEYAGVDNALQIPVLPAFRIGDLATAMGIRTRTIGLPEFEKAHEEMEPGKPSAYARMMSVSEIQIALDQVPEESEL